MDKLKSIVEACDIILKIGVAVAAFLFVDFTGVRSRVRSVFVMPTTIKSGIRPFRVRNSMVLAVWPMWASPSVMYSTG